jgi:hypothetical protein
MSQLNQFLDVHFKHLACELTEQELCRFGSPHVNRKEVYDELFPLIKQRTGAGGFSTDIAFTRNQIFCANEVFPEAVSADPLADLEIWHEWRQSIRRFPYPGLFSPLAIAAQNEKTTNPTSVGVIGEIFAGILSQAYIAPWVVVRPIRRFPDFIFLQRNGTYAFVESKAFTGNRSVKSHPLEKVPRTEMQECILNAVQQLNADPFIAVWYAFTEIQNIDPIEVSVIFLELTASSGTKDSKKCRFLPEALRKGLAERAVSSATASLEDSAHGQLFSASANRQKEQLFDVAAEESRRLIRTTVPETLQADALDSIAKEARKIAAKLKASPSDEGKRLEAAKKMVAEGRLGTLRSTPSGTLYLVDLTEEQLAKIERRWEPNRRSATNPWAKIDDTEFWRCSSAAVGHGIADLGWRSVQEL